VETEYETEKVKKPREIKSKQPRKRNPPKKKGKQEEVVDIVDEDTEDEAPIRRVLPAAKTSAALHQVSVAPQPIVQVIPREQFEEYVKVVGGVGNMAQSVGVQVTSALAAFDERLKKLEMDQKKNSQRLKEIVKVLPQLTPEWYLEFTERIKNSIIFDPSARSMTRPMSVLAPGDSFEGDHGIPYSLSKKPRTNCKYKRIIYVLKLIICFLQIIVVYCLALATIRVRPQQMSSQVVLPTMVIKSPSPKGARTVEAVMKKRFLLRQRRRRRKNEEFSSSYRDILRNMQTHIVTRR
jgi:hypothetical protein